MAHKISRRLLRLNLQLVYGRMSGRCLSTVPDMGHQQEEEDLPLARYGGRQTVTALPGDGIGPEMLDHVRQIFKVAQVPVDFEQVKLDSKPSTEGEDLENAIMSIERNGVALKGNVETKYHDPNLLSRNVQLRSRLDLYANVLWCKTIYGVPAKHKDVDVIIIRENTEGEYSGMEHETIPGVVESLKIVTRHNIERIAKFAFEYALKYNRRKVTIVHKANIMKIADGLFLHVCEEMAQNYPSLEFDNMIIDNTSMQLVQRPQQFDVMVMPNLYGNIVSNIACGVVGGPGLVSGSNIGHRYAVFETIHTPDIGGVNTTSEFVQAVLEHLGEQMKQRQKQ